MSLAAKARLPAIYSIREYVVSGGLMSYGDNLPANFRRAAYFVDKILRGAHPEELPVEQPTVFDFAVNQRTAQTLGITISPEVAAQVTEWVQ